MIAAATRRTIHLHPNRHDVLVERIEGESQNFILVCTRHQYAARPACFVEDVGTCPECDVERDAAAGRERYAALQQAWFGGQR